METVLHLQPVLNLTDEQFYEFCQLNRDVRIERNVRGEVLIMPPTGGKTGERNAEITMQLRLWAKRDATGTTFDSSSGFCLPSGSVRSPDAAWIRHEHLSMLNAEQKEKFIPLCPDFLIELRSPTDNLNSLREKMQEYLDNGAQLAWLIDADRRIVYVYRSHLPVEELQNPDRVWGDPLLSGFALDLRQIW